MADGNVMLKKIAHSDQLEERLTLRVGILAENTELARIVSASIKTGRTRGAVSRSGEN